MRDKLMVPPPPNAGGDGPEDEVVKHFIRYLNALRDEDVKGQHELRNYLDKHRNPHITEAKTHATAKGNHHSHQPPAHTEGHPHAQPHAHAHPPKHAAADETEAQARAEANLGLDVDATTAEGATYFDAQVLNRQLRADIEAIKFLTVADLKALCEHHKLSSEGHKHELEARLTELYAGMGPIEEDIAPVKGEAKPVHEEKGRGKGKDSARTDRAGHAGPRTRRHLSEKRHSNESNRNEEEKGEKEEKKKKEKEMEGEMEEEAVLTQKSQPRRKKGPKKASQAKPSEEEEIDVHADEETTKVGYTAPAWEGQHRTGLDSEVPLEETEMTLEPPSHVTKKQSKKDRKAQEDMEYIDEAAHGHEEESGEYLQKGKPTKKQKQKKKLKAQPATQSHVPISLSRAKRETTKKPAYGEEVKSRTRRQPKRKPAKDIVIEVNGDEEGGEAARAQENARQHEVPEEIEVHADGEMDVEGEEAVEKEEEEKEKPKKKHKHHHHHSDAKEKADVQV